MSVEKKLIITILLALTLIFLLGFFIIRPLFNDITDLAKKTENEQQSLEELYQRGKTLTQIQGELKQITDRQEDLEKIFFEQGKELDFITTLEKISSENNVTQDVSLRQQENYRDNYTIMGVGLDLEGSLIDLLKYFQSLEKLENYINITSFNLTPSPEKSNQLKISLEANTYWRK
jgi:Tfp pilus assembly protein PilO